MIDPSADRPVYLQVADDLRAQIADGRLPAGTTLPAEARMAYDYGVGQRTVRKALDELEDWGLVERRAGRAAMVRAPIERAVVKVPRGSVVTVVRPTPEQVKEYRLTPGELLVEVNLFGVVTRHGSDRVRLTVR